MINSQIILFKFIQTNDNVNWYDISYFYKLSENFIHEFQDKVDWYYDIKHIKILSENFIRRIPI